MDGWMNGRSDEWMDGRTDDGWINYLVVVRSVRLEELRHSFRSLFDDRWRYALHAGGRRAGTREELIDEQTGELVQVNQLH